MAEYCFQYSLSFGVSRDFWFPRALLWCWDHKTKQVSMWSLAHLSLWLNPCWDFQSSVLYQQAFGVAVYAEHSSKMKAEMASIFCAHPLVRVENIFISSPAFQCSSELVGGQYAVQSTSIMNLFSALFFRDPANLRYYFYNSLVFLISRSSCMVVRRESFEPGNHKWEGKRTAILHLGSIHSTSIFPHFVMLQAYSNLY